MRPAQKRVDDLQRSLDASRSALVEARAVEAAGTRETAADLANAQQIAICLSDEMVAIARGERKLEQEVEEAEQKLARLRGELAATRAERATLTGTAAVTGDRIVALKAKLEGERSKVAPLIERRAKEVERLERRIATVAAHQAARAAAKPPVVRTVLRFQQAPETAP